MSKISTIIDNFRTRMATILPDHKELRHVRAIEENDELFMAKGQAVAYGFGSNTNRNLSCRLSKVINVVATVTRAVRGHDRDVETRIEAEKDLLEDQLLIIKDIEKDASLDSITARIAYVSDNGIEEIFVGKGHYLMIQSNFELEYFEELT